MKLLVVTSLKEFREETSKLLDEAGIEVFSVTETVGYKRSHQQSLEKPQNQYVVDRR